jgi:hypothetical protein
MRQRISWQRIVKPARCAARYNHDRIDLRVTCEYMVASPEAGKVMRSIDVSIPNSGEALQRYVTTNLNLAAIPPDTLTEYISILGNN